MLQSLCDPEYRRATWVNTVFMFFHEFAGINVINLYSSEIFALAKHNSMFGPKVGTLLIGLGNVIGCVLSIATLKAFTRKGIMVWSAAMFAVLHTIVGISARNGYTTLELVGVFVFVMVYMNTSGPIAWVYAAETTTDAGLGFCLFALYLNIFILSLICPVLMQPNIIGPSNVFFMFGGISAIGAVWCRLYIKETKGLSDKEKKKIYN